MLPNLSPTELVFLFLLVVGWYLAGNLKWFNKK